MALIDALKRPLIIRTNYGDDSVALVQWVFEAGLVARVVYVDTGWAATRWEARIQQGEAHALRCGFKTDRILSKISFADAVIGRAAFPSVKFQWCTGLLKGLPFLDWLEPLDLSGEAIIVMAKRRAAAQAHQALSEWIQICEFHGDRIVWHPMIDINDFERNTLLERAGFLPLGHRSLECAFCVNSTIVEKKQLSTIDQERLVALEQDSGVTWTMNSPLGEKYLDLFYRGCGNQFGCGL